MDDKRAGLLAYLRAFSGRWLTLMSGPASVPFAVMAVYYRDPTLSTVFGCTAVVLAFTASFLTWRGERIRVLDLERQLQPIPGIQEAWAIINLTKVDGPSCDFEETASHNVAGVYNGSHPSSMRVVWRYPFSILSYQVDVQCSTDGLWSPLYNTPNNGKQLDSFEFSAFLKGEAPATLYIHAKGPAKPLTP